MEKSRPQSAITENQRFCETPSWCILACSNLNRLGTLTHAQSARPSRSARDARRARRRRACASRVSELHPATIADFSEGLSVEETWQLLDHAPVARQAEILTFFPPAKQVEMVTGAGRHLISKLLEAMPHDDRVELVRQLDPEVVEDLLPLVAKADREDIRRLLSYPEDSAGAMMTTDYAWLPRDINVAQAIEDLRKQASDKETIYYIYVLDENRRMLGFVSLRHLILAKPSAKIADIMQTEVISVRVDADREEVVKLLQRYDFLAIPVLDEQHRLVGIITHDDAIDVVVEEATEDALHQAGVASIDESYIDAPFRDDLAEAGSLPGRFLRCRGSAGHVGDELFRIGHSPRSWCWPRSFRSVFRPAATPEPRRRRSSRGRWPWAT